LNRAQRHVREVPDSLERGYVAIAAAMWSGYCGDCDEAVKQAAWAHDLGEARGDRNLAAWALAMLGGMQVAGGDVAGGVATLDEAMIETVSGDLVPFVAGWIYCFLLKTCQGLGDVHRAREWTETAVRWCEQNGVDSWYPGVCRLHRCEVASLHGEWASAEQEALRAAEDLAPFGSYLIAEGQYIAGEIRRRRGDYSLAEEAFRRRLVARGMSNREVASTLVISEHTVRRHLSNVFRKIGVTSRSAATAFAFEHDLAG
jgi:ATP/maltotriose-dependent transcriptional regulator MalT